MGLEAIEPPATVYIDDLVSANPVGTTDQVKSLDNHIRGIKNVLLLSFPNINGAVSGTPAELNVLAGVTAGTAAASKALVLDASLNVTGVNSFTATTFVGNLTGNVTGNADTATTATTATTAANVITNANLTGDVTSVGNATTLAANSVTTAKIANDAITSDKLAVDSVTFANEIVKPSEDGSISCGAGTTTTFTPVGVFNIYDRADIRIEIYAGAAGGAGWGTLQGSDVATATYQQIVSDGTNVRIYNDNISAITVYYKKIVA